VKKYIKFFIHFFKFSLKRIYKKRNKNIINFIGVEFWDKDQNKGHFMLKRSLSLLFASLLAISFTACANSQKVQPKNIDKNNVSNTSMEEPDQTDPTLIEGNLEKNDFKN